MQGIRVRLAHASPGRIRLKADEIKGDDRRAREIEEELRRVTGIRSVDANPVTGSLLVTYDESALDSMELPFSVARVLGISLNDLDPEELRLLMSHRMNGSAQTGMSVSEGLESALQEVNTTMRRAVGLDLTIAVPLLLALLGVRSLLTMEKTVVPSWHDYMWFAFSSYFILNRLPPAHRAR